MAFLQVDATTGHGSSFGENLTITPWPSPTQSGGNLRSFRPPAQQFTGLSDAHSTDKVRVPLDKQSAMPDETALTAAMRGTMLRDLQDLLDVLDRRLAALRKGQDRDAVAHVEALRNQTAERIRRLETEPAT